MARVSPRLEYRRHKETILTRGTRLRAFTLLPDEIRILVSHSVVQSLTGLRRYVDFPNCARCAFRRSIARRIDGTLACPSRVWRCMVLHGVLWLIRCGPCAIQLRVQTLLRGFVTFEVHFEQVNYIKSGTIKYVSVCKCFYGKSQSLHESL